VEGSHELWLGSVYRKGDFPVPDDVSSFEVYGLMASPANLSNFVRGIRVM